DAAHSPPFPTRRSSALYRPGDRIAPVDLDAARLEAEKAAARQVTDSEFCSYLMYPKVFRDYAEHRRNYGDVSRLPTQAFFYGMRSEEHTSELQSRENLV